MAVILTFAEARDGKLRRPSLEAVSEAPPAGRRARRRRGRRASWSARASTAWPPSSARYGADEVHLFDDPALEAYATEPYARALAQVDHGDEARRSVLVPATATGKDLAPRVAAKVGAGLVSDCVALVRQGRPAARRAARCTRARPTRRCAWEGEPQMATLRPNVFPLGKPDAGRKAEIVKGAGRHGRAGAGHGRARRGRAARSSSARPRSSSPAGAASRGPRTSTS